MPADRSIEQMLKEWKEAEQRAREAELQVYRAYAESASGKSPGPSEQMKREATALRAQARAAYHVAMAAVDRVLEEADRRSRGF